MDSGLGVIVFYVALVVWFAVFVVGVRNRSYWPTLIYGTGLMVYLNGRYLLDGAPDSIAFFIGIYDIVNNLGLSPGDEAGGLATCVDNACTVWSDRYARHSSWGVAFYDRFANGSQGRTNLLFGHIVGNSIAFILLHWQLLRPGDGANPARHRLVGRVTFGAVTVGVAGSVLLAAEHGPVSEYGGNLSMTGFWLMALCVYVPAVMGVVTIHRGDAVAHRKWMTWFAGAMWGSFWLFRVMLFVLDPLLRNFETAAILACIWLSAPLGIAIAEGFRRRSERASTDEQSPADISAVPA